MIKKINNTKKYEERKGEIIELMNLNQDQLSTIDIMSQRLGDLLEVRKYKTGTYGAYFQNNQFRFIKGDKKTNTSNISDWKIVNTLKKDFNNENLQDINNMEVIDNTRYEVTDNRWSKSPNNRYLHDIDTKIGGAKKKIGLKKAVELLRKYYSNNS